MDAVAFAEQFIRANPSSPDSDVLGRLLQSLRARERFDVHELYTLTLTNFEVAMQVVEAWRLQRYYRGGVTVPAAQPLAS